MKAVVDAGHRISQVTPLDANELQRRSTTPEWAPPGDLDEILAALTRLDDTEARRLMSLRVASPHICQALNTRSNQSRKAVYTPVFIAVLRDLVSALTTA